MRRYTVFLLIVLAALLLPLCAQAREIKVLYVCDADTAVAEGKTVPVEAIRWKKTDSGKYDLYLPACMDTSSLRVYLTGDASDFEVNGETVANRELTGAFVPGTTVTVSNGKNRYEVTVYQSANAGAVYLRTESGSLNYLSESKRHHEGGSVKIVDVNGEISYEGELDYVRLRGNYSFQVVKKSFHLKLPVKAKILGMKKAKTWLLLANYCDNSQIRDAIALDMADAAGMTFSMHYRFVDVYVNNSYYGTFMLTEKVQVGKNRVEIFDLEEATEALNSRPLSSYGQMGTDKVRNGSYKYYNIPNDPEDITGGYLIQIELSKRYVGSMCGFVTDCGQCILVKSPEFASKAQMQYIRSLVQSFENAISAEDGIDPVTGRHYTEIADMTSMVQKYLIEEIMKNLDGNKTSFYMYKYPDSVSTKLFFGPVWDFDNSLGVYSDDKYAGKTNVPEGLLVGEKPGAERSIEEYYFFPKLYAHEDFRAAVKEAYRTVFRPMIEVLLGQREPSGATGNLRSLDEYEALLAPSTRMNFLLRPTLGKHDRDFPVNTGKTYHDNIEYIRDFLTVRMAYLDSIWLDEGE
ncbi:MAG: hypothetical protein CW338_00465 [Clostridiales bacterium]|nr:hypothetical protein [Clostridiales bacterium]